MCCYVCQERYVFSLLGWSLCLSLCQSDYIKSNERICTKLQQRCVSGQGTIDYELDTRSGLLSGSHGWVGKYYFDLHVWKTTL